METEKLRISDFYKNVNYDLPHFKNQIYTRTATKEFETAIEGKFDREIPKWLSGILISNGPGKYTVGDQKLNHHYDGLGLLQKFQIFSSGKVTYQNKFVQSEAHVRGCKENRVIFSELGTKASANPSQKVLNKFMGMIKPEVTDNTNITLAVINDEFYATSDSSKINKIDLMTLDKIEMVDLEQKFKITGNCSHLHTTKDGTVYSLGLSFTAAGAAYNVIEIPRNGDGFAKGKVVGKMNATSKFSPCLMHSFGMTENFFIVIETPLRISILDHIKNGVNSMSIHEGLRWRAEELSRFHLISRKTGKRQHTFYSDPFMSFHIANQYEKNDHVVIDVVCYLNHEIFDVYWMEKLENDDADRTRKYHANVLRFVLPLNYKDAKESNLITLEDTKAFANSLDGKIYCTPELMLDYGCEFPAINYSKYSGVEYKFLYAKGRDGSAIKVNLTTKEKTFWREEGIFIGEPVFISTPDGQEEDDGVIVATFIKVKDANVTGLVVLDAKNLDEVARCEFDLGTDVPMSLHSVFVKGIL